MMKNKSSRSLIIFEVLIVVLAFSFGFYRFYTTEKIDESTFINKVDIHNNDIKHDSMEEFDYYEKDIKFSKEVEDIISKLTLEEKIAQLFIANPEDYYSIDEYELSCGENTRNKINELPVGGLLYSGHNINSYYQAKDLFLSTNDISYDRIGLPLFITLDEDGFDDVQYVNRGYTYSNYWIANNVSFDDYDYYFNEKLHDLSDIGVNLFTGYQINGTVDSDNPKATYSDDYFLIYEIVEKELALANETDVIFAAKYFPFDENKEDYTTDELLREDLLVYQLAIDSGVKAITVNDTVSAAIDEYNPVLLSNKTVDVIRARMGYEGLLLSKPLRGSYLYDSYSEDELIVNIFNSGIDVIVDPVNYKNAYNAILKAYNDGEIKESRLHNALGRIIQNKLDIASHREVYELVEE